MNTILIILLVVPIVFLIIEKIVVYIKNKPARPKKEKEFNTPKSIQNLIDLIDFLTSNRPFVKNESVNIIIKDITDISKEIQKMFSAYKGKLTNFKNSELLNSCVENVEEILNEYFDLIKLNKTYLNTKIKDRIKSLEEDIPVIYDYFKTEFNRIVEDNFLKGDIERDFFKKYFGKKDKSE